MGVVDRFEKLLFFSKYIERDVTPEVEELNRKQRLADISDIFAALSAFELLNSKRVIVKFNEELSPEEQETLKAFQWANPKKQILVFTQPEIVKDGYRFIRCVADRYSMAHWEEQFGLTVKHTGGPGDEDYFFYDKNNELVFFTSIEIGWKDAKAKLHKEPKTFSEAHYVREDRLDLLEYKYVEKTYPKGSCMYKISKYFGGAFDKVFKEASKKQNEEE